MSFISILTTKPWLFLTLGLLFGLLPKSILSSSFFSSIKKFSPTLSKKLLQLAIIFLGASLPVSVIVSTGLETFLPNLIQISLVLIFSFLLSKLLTVDRVTGFLLGVGTAICGGSAIAAVTPFLLASSTQTGLSLTIVFILNALALFVFPSLGKLFELTQVQFGMWSALSIHDTSSVVGAASQFGKQALAIATTQKLTRALWMIPIAFFVSTYTQRKNKKTPQNYKKNHPWFILWFLLMSSLFSYFSLLKPLQPYFSTLGQLILCLAIFLIGTTLDTKTLKNTGRKTLFFGIILWLFSICLGLGLAMRFA